MIRDTKKFIPKHPAVMATSTTLVDGGDNDCGGGCGAGGNNGGGELDDEHEGEGEEEFNVDNDDMNLGISL
ncbi:hypothetical protein PV327_003794 [Microctonus hyperodae]|uniref:Uncharacterized protein n=1 Tax=Microctonus hyperodae TaxID=165561 RepID=A0AA39G5P6_MICHY|nr:hypothetical protein PV327_003794 [Microctonus hyperodae]